MRNSRSKKTRPGKRRPASRAAAGTVTLPAELSIERAAALHAQLAPHLAMSAQVVLDASALLRVHTAPMQVLAAFFRARAEAGRATAWREPSAALRVAATRLGLAAPLGLSADSLN